ncbi:MAG: hypothetical protein WC740_21550 [Verrucomicrobiia bacterium]
MKLIADVSPVCYARIRREFRGFLVNGIKGARAYNACWNRTLETCELDIGYMCSEDATLADVATTIIHEATHAHLFHKGIDYNESRRARVERACFRAQIRFAKRLPDGKQIVDSVIGNMQREQSYWTNDALIQREADAFVKAGCSRRLVQVILAIGKWRAARRHDTKTGTS